MARLSWVASALLALVCAVALVHGGSVYSDGHVFQLAAGQTKLWLPFVKNRDRCLINNVRVTCFKNILHLPKNFVQGSLTINNRVIFSQFYVGKVFMCSGQSNMHHPVGLDMGAEEIEARADSRIHFYGFRSTKHAEVPWTNTDAREASSICYNFALEYLALHPNTKHIGLIKTAIGSTSLDQWLPKSFRNRPRPTVSSSRRGKLWVNFMKPLFRLRFEGILWYQGESNVDFATSYEQPFNKFLSSLRSKWPTTKIVVFGLSTFVNGNLANLAAFREMQMRVTLSFGNSAFVHSYDLGDPFEKNVKILGRNANDPCPGPGDALSWYGHHDWCDRFSAPGYGKASVHPRTKSRLGFRAMQGFDGHTNPKVIALSRNRIQSGLYDFNMRLDQDCALGIDPTMDTGSSFLLASINNGASFQSVGHLVTRKDSRNFVVRLQAPGGAVILRHAQSARPCCAASEKVCPPESCGWKSTTNHLPVDPFTLTLN